MLFGDLGKSTPFPAEQPEIPDLAMIDRVRVMRTAGARLEGECLGVGFLRKNIYKDRVNWQYPNFVLVMVLQGKGKYIDSSNTAYDLTEGSCFVRVPNIEHSNFVEPGSGYLECYLEIGPLFFQALNGLEQLPLTPPVRTIAREHVHLLAGRFWNLGWRLNYADESGFAACITDVITLLFDIKTLANPGTKGCKYQDLVDLACRELSRDFTGKFSLHKFCRQHSVGYENFRKLFRMQVGLSPVSYRIRCKLESAAVLLHNENLSISEIASLLGYNNAYEFSAQFKTKFGIAPSRFRNQK